MDALSERLQEALSARGLEPMDLVNRTGLSKGTIYNILNRTTRADKIRAVTLDSICESLSVDRDWLLYGRGTMDVKRMSSQSVGLDLSILTHADWWVQYEEAQRGKQLLPVSPSNRDDYLRRLAHVYALAQADGGRLSPAHADEIIEAAKGESNGRGKDRDAV